MTNLRRDIISEMEKQEKIIIFTDGASRGNPGPGGWGAVVVRDGSFEELGGKEDGTTNNRMELKAAIEALKKISDDPRPVVIYTDSSYVVNGITKWVRGWKAKGWVTSQKQEVLNRELWEELHDLAESRDTIKWTVVSGHSGVFGNERADVIATEYADTGDFRPLSKDDVPGTVRRFLDVKVDSAKHSERSASKSRSRAAAYSYLSMLDGIIEKHATWAECERRVKGKPAKFKKALSAEEERDIISEWRRG